MQPGYSQRMIAMSCSFLIKDTIYCELLNKSRYRQDIVKESVLCHVLSSLKIQPTVSY